jgi:hypothetical protein
MRSVARKKGDFTLFAKLMRSDAPGTWDLVVSAPWLEEGQLKGISELVELLSDSLGEEDLHYFSRIVTVGEDNPTVQFMLQNLATDDAEIHVRSTDLFDLQIDEAVIFRAKKPGPSRNGSPKALHAPTATSGRGRG